MKFFTSKLFLIISLFCFNLNLFAQLSQDFTTNTDAWIPTKETTTVAKHVSPTSETWGFCKSYFGGGYLMIKSTGYIILPTFDFEVSNIKVKTKSGASSSVYLKLYADGELVESKKLDPAGASFEYKLSTQKVGAVYKFEAFSKNAQIESIEVSKNTLTAAIIPTDDTFNTYTLKNIITKKALKVSAFGLNEDITLSITGESKEFFSLEESTLSKDGGEVMINYESEVLDEHMAKLILSSGTISAEVLLVGTSVPNEGTEENPLTIADVNWLNNGYTQKVWVKGTIKGSACQTNPSNILGIDKEVSEASLALLSDNVEVSLPVSLPEGSIREALNLVSNAHLLDQEVMLYGSLVSYFGRPGLKFVEDHKILTSTAISETISETPAIKVVGNQILVTTTENCAIEVYNLTGNLQYTTMGYAYQTTTIDGLLSNTVYLVKVGDQVSKVVIR